MARSEIPTLGAFLADGAPGAAQPSASDLDDALRETEVGGPWYVRLLVGGAVCVGAGLLATFLVALDFVELLTESEGGKLIVGALALVGGGLARRLLRPDVGTPLMFIGSFVGQSLFLALADALAPAGQSSQWVIVTGLLLQVGIILAYPSALHRLVSAVAIPSGLVWLVTDLGVPLGTDLVLALSAAAALGPFLFAERLATHPATAGVWRPVAYGLTVSVLGLYLFYGGLIPLAGVGALTGSDAALLALLPGVPPLMVLIVCGLWVGICLKGAGRLGGGLGGVAPALGAGILVCILCYRVPGIPLALALLALGVLEGEGGLKGLALAFIGPFLALFYYQLDVTLLAKSLWVTGTGVGLLGIGWAIGRLSASPEAASGWDRRTLIGAGGMLALAALCASVVLGMAAQKEGVVRGGEVILLPLAPRDPRSLMQGDYMVLAYAAARALEAVEDVPMDGHLILSVDDAGVGRLKGVDRGAPLGPGEARLRYRRRGEGEVRIGAESYFFEEGTAHLYNDARYGALAVDGGGNSVLLGLRGEDRAPLGPPPFPPFHW